MVSVRASDPLIAKVITFLNVTWLDHGVGPSFVCLDPLIVQVITFLSVPRLDHGVGPSVAVVHLIGYSSLSSQSLMILID